MGVERKGQSAPTIAVPMGETLVLCHCLLNKSAEVVIAHCGDLFEPVGNKRFDLVMCSLPKFRGEPTSAFEVSWRSADVIDRFAAGLPDVLKPNGFALVLLTSHGDERGMLAGLETSGLAVEVAQRSHFGVEILTIYKVTHSSHEHYDHTVRNSSGG